MSRISIRLGFWSALLIAVAFLIYTICFIAIVIVNPMFLWTNMSDYLTYVNANSQLLKHVAQFAMLAFGPLLVILLNSIHERTSGDKKIMTRISICFGLGAALLIGMSYFVQISSVRQNILHGTPGGLEQFVQANPASAMTAMNMLGWTLFLGLASLFVATVFSGGGTEKVIKYAFLANGIACLLGGVGYVLEITVLVFLCINLGMGGAILVATVALSVWFRRMGRALTAEPDGI